MSAHSNLNQKQRVQEVKANKIIRFKDYAKKIHIPVQESKRANIFSLLENNMAEKKSSQLRKVKICGSIILLAAIALYFSLA